MSKQYRVKVDIPGKLIFFKNRKIRSPFSLKINEGEIDLLKSTMISSGVSEYTIEDYKDDVKEDVWNDDVIIPENVETVVEELIDEEEPTTLLGKLLRDDKNGE